MTLQTGTRLGPYEIVSRVGAGGMGEVFRALDTRLDRTVAVKTLPVELARNSQLRLRFQREAKAISALSHPHICALYDVGEHDGVDYLVMEYLEGETLAERLSRGPLPLKEALKVGIEIAGALERAHREGVVHRDLKPGNVMLTRNGAKLLDFGLAKAASATTTISAEDPTVQHASTPLTAEGTIVGTFQYMAPEQLEGQHLDHRTDIFAFGALLYEMITGIRAFSGKTRTSLIASIVGSSPRPMAEIAPVTPPELEHVVQRCLEKEPEARWQSAHDIGLELEWIARAAGKLSPRAAGRSRVWLGLAAGILLLAAAAAWFAGRKFSRPEPLPSSRTHLLAPKGKSLEFVMDTLSISPDGRHVTFSVRGDRRLWIRAVDSMEARPIDGTEDGRFPFWSPDSRWIAFFDFQKLKKVTLNGAPPISLCDAPRGRSGSWNEDGVILFSPTATSGIHRVPAAGGVPQQVTELDAGRKETTHRWARFLPDGKRFLYFAGAHAETVGSEDHAIYLSSLDEPGNRTLVTRARSNAAFSNGHLLFVRDQFLVAQRFDEGRGTLSGEPFRIAEGLEYDAEFFRAAFAVSDRGVLVYHTLVSPPMGELRWLENGTLGPPLTPPLPFRGVTLSPDHKRAAAAVIDRTTGLPDIWVIDLESGRQNRLTNTPGVGDEAPVWTPDGKSLVYSTHQGFQAGGDLVVIAADGSSAPRKLYERTKESLPRSVSRAGILLFDDIDDLGGGRQEDVSMIPLAGGNATPFLAGPLNESRADFSPDGKWIGFIRDGSDGPQVFATTFPDRKANIQISSRVAFVVMWRADGILYADQDAIYHVPVRIEGDRLVVGDERRIPGSEASVISGDAVSGERLLVAVRPSDPYENAVAVVTGWQTH
jgi:eukaryotic-like serine/threonine-protein kinase